MATEMPSGPVEPPAQVRVNHSHGITREQGRQTWPSHGDTQLPPKGKRKGRQSMWPATRRRRQSERPSKRRTRQNVASKKWRKPQSKEPRSPRKRQSPASRKRKGRSRAESKR